MLILITLFAIVVPFALILLNLRALRNIPGSKPAFPRACLFSLLTICGATLAMVNVKNIQEGFYRRSWPVVTGVITHSEVVGGRVYQPAVYYTYTVNQKDFKGETDLNVPYFGAPSTRKEVAYKSIAEYQEGNTVSIFYDPHNPGESSLRPGPKWSDFTRLSLGTLLYSAGIIGASVFLRANKETP